MGVTATSMGFVDDINILTYGKTTERNCQTLSGVHAECERWARRHGATFAPKKYELLHLTRTPRKFNMAANITFEGRTITPKEHIRILGIQIDTKLRWGPHLQKIEEKNATQMLAMSKLGASTWGATFARARQIYTSVVRPAITYGASVWHQRGKGDKPAEKEKRLEKLQNKALRNITGAFKKVSTETLEAEAYVPPIHITLDRLQDRSTLRLRETGMEREINRTCEEIRTKLSMITRLPKATPGSRKREALDKALEEGRDIIVGSQHRHSARPQAQRSPRKDIDAFHHARWEKRWETYRNKHPRATRTPAQEADLALSLRVGLRKAESTLATHIRTEKIGLRAYLFARKVPGFDSAACPCGWNRRTTKHVLVHCPLWEAQRNRVFQTATSIDYRKMVSTASEPVLANEN